jgi:hypothetical protein
MERPEMLDGLQVSPDQVPKFQAYLRQQLVFEHHKRKLRRSQQRWMASALIAFGLVGFGLVRPGSVVRVHDSLFPQHETAVSESYALGNLSVPLEGTSIRQNALARTLAASLEQERMLIRDFGGESLTHEVTLPEEAVMVSRYPLRGGRQMEVYTTLVPRRDEFDTNTSFASDGGAW